MGEWFFADAEVRPAPSLFALDEAGLEKDFQVVADGWLAEPERLGEVADARLVVRLCLDQAEEPEPCGIGDRFQGLGEPFGVVGLDRRLEQWRTGERVGNGRLHNCILTEIDCFFIMAATEGSIVVNIWRLA